MATIDGTIRDGNAWFASVYNFSVGNGVTVYLGFTTGDQYVRLANRRFGSPNGEAISTLYQNSTYTGGVSVPLRSRNQRSNAVVAVPPLVAFAGVTPDPLSPTNIIGDDIVRASGQSPHATIIDSHFDTIFLNKEMSYVIAIENIGSGTAVFDMSAVFIREGV